MLGKSPEGGPKHNPNPGLLASSPNLSLILVRRHFGAFLALLGIYARRVLHIAHEAFGRRHVSSNLRLS
jgi:hypothetical protein